MSNSLGPHGLQHTGHLCLSPTPGAYSKSRWLSQWCHPTIFPSMRVFSNESVLPIRWPKYRNFSFSISPFNEYSGLISFKMYWFDLLAVQGTLKGLLQHHSSKIISFSALSFLYGLTLTSIHAAAAKSLQSCLTLCDPIDGSSPGSPVPAILQARTLEWVVISFSNVWKWKVKGKSLSRVQLFAGTLVFW